MNKLMLNLCSLALMLSSAAALSQNKDSAGAAKPEDTEQWEPVPPKVLPGADCAAAPSDAIVLFDGRNLDEWVMTNDRSPARWRVENGAMVVDKTVGNIETKRLFRNYQLHLEYRIPADITGEGQGRGNSGLFPGVTGSRRPPATRFKFSIPGRTRRT